MEATKAAAPDRKDLARAFHAARRRVLRTLRRWLPHLVPSTVAEKRVEKLRMLEDLTAEERSRLEPLVRAYETDYAWATLSGRYAGLLISTYSLLPAGLALIWIAPALTDVVLRSTSGVDGGPFPMVLASFPWGVTATAAGVFTLLAWQAFRDRGQRLPRWMRWGIKGIYGISFGIILWHLLARQFPGVDYHDSERAWETLMVGMVVFGVGTLMLLARQILAINLSPARRRLYDDVPCALVVHEMLNVMARLPNSEAEWGRIDKKRDVVRRLDRIARAFDPHVGGYFSCSHPVMDQWISQRCAEISASVQGVAKLAFSPGRGNHEWFRRQVAELFVNLAEGAWDAFPQVEQKPAPHHSFWSRVIPLLRRLLIVLSPALLLAAYQIIRLDSMPKVTMGTTFTVALLTMTGLISVLNPQVQADVALAKSVGDIFKLGQSTT